MKITKEQGRACIAALSRYTGTADWRDYERFSVASTNALIELGWLSDGNGFDFSGSRDGVDGVATALAMCAAIAGVKPEDVE